MRNNMIDKIASYVYCKSVEEATISGAPNITIDEVERYFDLVISRETYQSIVDVLRTDYYHFLLDVNDNDDDYCYKLGVFSLNIGTKYCYNFSSDYDYGDEQEDDLSWLDDLLENENWDDELEELTREGD